MHLQSPVRHPCCWLSPAALFFLSSGSLHAGMLVLFGAAMGTLNSSILIPFVFRLNNSEKFYAVIGANLLISVLLFLREVRIFDITAGSTGALIMLAAGLLPVFRSGSRIRRRRLVFPAPPPSGSSR
jgi:hypothetical protein